MSLKNLNSAFSKIVKPSVSQINSIHRLEGGIHQSEHSRLDTLDLPVSSDVTKMTTKTSDIIFQSVTEKKFPSETNWSNLYESDHTSKFDAGYKYGGNVNNTFSMRDGNGPGVSRTQLLGLGAGEPYIVSKLPETDSGFSGGRLLNSGNRYLPIGRALTDTLRIGKYLSSPAGLLFLAKENLHTVIPINVVKKGNNLVRVPQKHHGLNTLSTLAATGGRLLGEGLPNVLLDRTDSVLGLTFDGGKYGKSDEVVQTFTGHGGGLNLADIATNLLNFPAPKKHYKGKGDKMTLAPMLSGKSLTRAGYDRSGLTNFVESEKEGMPFYFKDMRDDTYIIFRGYIEGLTENVSPTWSEETYIGRSEPVYIYENGKRTIDFTLKLFAQTAEELASIYGKLTKLTSLCYPEYQMDDNFGDKDDDGNFIPDTGKVRMKPPLTSFRMGELYGNNSRNLMGFINTISYNYPDETPWETEAGKRVPKHISATIGFTVIHKGTPPNKLTNFYGYN
mgnify:CR=1 FL=1|tara:strand:- start:3345 stop:4853 length:1509 start_codon:yes stop_codon:yes gene_type:complete